MTKPKLDLAVQDAITRIKFICDGSQGRSQFFPYGGSGYKASVTHYFESSTDVAAGAVQPGSEEDLAKIVKVIAATHVKFAVKCGGHSTNPGFSSTNLEGIQIDLSRLNNINVDKANMRVRVGAGCLFEELYQELDTHNINIVGGSGLSGVGVAGWMLGGGYSVKTSQHGLGVDNLESAKVVLPDGTIKVASDKKNDDLFFAIKGGGNNYGIVSEFTLKAHDQGKFYDGVFEYERQYFSQVKQAISNFIEKVPEDNKANIEAAFRHYNLPGKAEPKITLTVHCVYDGDYPDPDPFKELKDIPHKGNELVTPPMAHETGSFLLADLRHSYLNGTYDLMSKITLDSGLAVISDIPELEKPKPPMNGIGQFPRGRWGNVMVDKFTLPIINEIEKQSYEVAKGLGENGGTRVAIGLWPFTSTMFDNTTDSAFPHVKGKPNCPIIVYFTWEGEHNDKYWISTMKTTLKTLREKVQNPESKNLPYFINTALWEDTTVEDLYRGNLPRLKEVRGKYDPQRVMDRTGGFRIPLAQGGCDKVARGAGISG